MMKKSILYITIHVSIKEKQQTMPNILKQRITAHIFLCSYLLTRRWWFIQKSITFHATYVIKKKSAFHIQTT